MGESDQTVFIVDLNELENGNELPVSMDFTMNAGPGVLGSWVARPTVGHQVYVYSDDDRTRYCAEVVTDKSTRDLVVRIDWGSGVPVINEEWRAC